MLGIRLTIWFQWSKRAKIKFHIFSWPVFPQDTCQDSNHQTNAPRIQGKPSLKQRLRSLSLRNAQQVRRSWSTNQPILSTKGWGFHPAVPLQHWTDCCNSALSNTSAQDRAPQSLRFPACQLDTNTGGKRALSLPCPWWQPVVQPRDRVALGQDEVTVPRKARASSGAQLPQGPGRMSPFSHTGLSRGCPTCPSSSSEGPTAARLCQDMEWGHRTAVSPQCHHTLPAGQAPAAIRWLPLQEQNPQTPNACSQHFLAPTHHPQPYHLFISGQRMVLTKEATIVSNTCVSSDLKATNAVNSVQRMNIISPHLNHARSGKDFITMSDPHSKLPSHPRKVMHLY